MGRRLWWVSALTLVVGALLFVPAVAGAATRHGTACVARHVIYVDGKIEVHYRPGCTGHDEPELDPVSSLPHSAQNLTWKAVLPTDGAFPVSGTGFGFWFGGTVTDPHSLFHQAFLEVQFYPDTLVSRCDPNGNSQFTFSRNTYTVCTPVWSVVGNNEPAAFNAMLRVAGGDGPLVMHGGDTILLHYYQTPARDGAHITVTDLTTHERGTVILNSKRWGPLMPAFSRQVIGNALGWGIVDDAPNSFVWEIGHRSDFSARPGAFCAPGHSGCESYNWRAWFEHDADPDPVGDVRQPRSRPGTGRSSATTAARPRSSTPRRPARPACTTAGRTASIPGTARTPTGRSATASTTRSPRTASGTPISSSAAPCAAAPSGRRAPTA